MADAITSTRGGNGMADADVQELNDLLDQARDKIVEMGLATEIGADAMLFAARPNTTTVVGNLADLQRMGAVAAGSQDDSAVKAAFEGELVGGDTIIPPPPENPNASDVMNRASGVTRGSGSVTNEQIAQQAGRGGGPDPKAKSATKKPPANEE